MQVLKMQTKQQKLTPLQKNYSLHACCQWSTASCEILQDPVLQCNSLPHVECIKCGKKSRVQNVRFTKIVLLFHQAIQDIQDTWAHSRKTPTDQSCDHLSIRKKNATPFTGGCTCGGIELNITLQKGAPKHFEKILYSICIRTTVQNS